MAFGIVLRLLRKNPSRLRRADPGNASGKQQPNNYKLGVLPHSAGRHDRNSGPWAATSLGDHKGTMPADSAIWRSIRRDFERLPNRLYPGVYRLIWTSRRSADWFWPAGGDRGWTWFRPSDPDLCAFASTIFLKAAKARGYERWDQWLDELRFTESVQFQISGHGKEKRPNGNFVDLEWGHMENVVADSIRLCEELEVDDVPKPIVMRLPQQATSRIDATLAAFLSDFVPKVKSEAARENAQNRRFGEAKLLQELVICYFVTVARECITSFCNSAADIESELPAAIGRFVLISLRQYGWLSEAMKSELEIGFDFYTTGANPWAGISDEDKDSRWHVGALTGETLSNMALKFAAEIQARRTENALTAEVPKSSGVARKRGPKPGYESARLVAKIVTRVAPDGDWKSKLPEVCSALRDAEIPEPSRWENTSWAKQEDNLVVKVIRRRLELARKLGN